MANPLQFTTGTTTVNSTKSLRVSKITVIALSATAVTGQLFDLNGNPLSVLIAVPAVANSEVTADYTVPMLLPGGASPTVTNAVAVVTGAGGVMQVYHR